MFNYIRWLTIFVWIPTAVLWAIYPWILRKYWKVLSGASLGALIFSIPWDLWALKTEIWTFPVENNVGIWLLGLPLEEHFFMIFITTFIASVFLIIRENRKDNR